MTVAARALRGEVASGAGGVLVDSVALDDGVDVMESLAEAFSTEGILGAIGGAIDDLPERIALMNGLAMEAFARGWAFVVFITGGCGALAAGLRLGFTTARGVDPTGKDGNRLGSIWSSVIVLLGSDGTGRGGESVFSPNGPRGELGGSASNWLSNPWRQNAQEIGSEGPPFSFCK